ncbi:AMP-binding protein [Paraconexibacter antarcticus]|uniref:Acyl-CoA synthetase n=1 Tax=Paraconexibacter antarcticus TaxID=2949664 RepID=A0ABY5DNL9_9ACTN|nr:AMP-binding protein [Paraconexibacter antarcticus]UTI63620.1 AMP-binding protein [Paraconexibacter antarcticus]
MAPAPAGATAYDASSALAASTLCEAFQMTAAGRGDAVALRLPDDSFSMTWTEYAERVRELAEGLASLGVERGGAVALLMSNRPEVNLADTAAIHLGAAAFSIYQTNPAKANIPLINNSGAKVLVTEPAFLEVALKTRELAPTLETIVVVDEARGGADLTFAELAGRRLEGFDFDACWRALEPEDVVTLVYTSGTTGEPKGVQHTHLSLLHGLRGLEEFDHVTPGGRLVSFLPMAHIAERWISHYASMVWGHAITACPDPKQLAAALGSTRPTRLFGVPRVFEKLAAAVEGMAAADPEGPLADALNAGLARVRAEQAAGTTDAKNPDDGLTETQRATLAGVRAKLGLDCLEWTCVAAAPSTNAMHETYHAIGIPMLQIWGMSECVFSCITPIDRIKIGTVGRQVPGVEVKLAEDGEILVRGRNLMSGYRNEPEKTKEAIDEDGWLWSGDVAVQEGDFYRIVDRKKELIINSAGKNMSPQKIEMAIKETCSLIGQVAAIGDGKLYVTALVSLDEEAATAYAEKHGLEPDIAKLCTDPGVCAQVAAAIATANESLARVEQIKTHTILPTAWQPGGDEITPTMKLKRRIITEKYEAEIDAMYASAS